MYSAVTVALTGPAPGPRVAGVSAGPADRALAKTRRNPIVKSLRHNYDLYLLLLPALAYLIIFKYAPMYGLQISFRDFNPVQGMWGSPWAGLKHFFRFFDSYMFVTVVRNTLALNLYQLLVGFPIPIMLALLLNQVPNQRFKKTVQTSIYAPHFISMVVMVGMLHIFLSPRSGLVNHAIGLLGAEPVYFFGKAGYFRSLYVWSGHLAERGLGHHHLPGRAVGGGPRAARGGDRGRRHQAAAHPAHRHSRHPPIAVILLILEMGDAVITSHALSNTASDRVFNAVNYLFLTVILLAVAYPLYFMAIASFSDPHLVNNGKLWLLLITVNRVARRLSGAIRAGTACQARLHHPERQHLLGAEQPELLDREQSGHPQHPHAAGCSRPAWGFPPTSTSSRPR